jgi:hypothetical protein
LDHLYLCFIKIPSSDANTEGHNRNLDLRTNGYATYQQLGRIKNYFDNYGGDKTDAPYILNGSDTMLAWVNNTLDSLRNGDKLDQTIKKEYADQELDPRLTKDLGWLANLPNQTDPHKGPIDDLKITESLNRINEIIKKII